MENGIKCSVVFLLLFIVLCTEGVLNAAKIPQKAPAKVQKPAVPVTQSIKPADTIVPTVAAKKDAPRVINRPVKNVKRRKIRKIPTV